MRVPTALVLLLAAVTFVAGLGRGAITDSDEAFYAEASREMVESGDWLTPVFNYEPRFQKPVLYYWLTAGTFRVAGQSEAAARLWAALAGVGLVLLTVSVGRRSADEASGALAGAIAATSFGYVALARMALPDLPLAFFSTAATWAAMQATLDRERAGTAWWIAAAALAAGGFLTKGPLAVILPGLVLLPLLVIERRWSALHPRHTLPALAVFAAIALPWYLAMWREHGTSYLQSFFIGDNLERFATERFNEARPWWFYLPVLAGGLLPWTPLAGVWLSALADGIRGRSGLGVSTTRLVVWALLPLLFFTLSIGKQPRYILPVLPPLAVLLAMAVSARTRAWRGTDGARRLPGAGAALRAGAVLSGGLLLVLAALVWRARLLFVDAEPGMTLGAAALVAACGLATVVAALVRGGRGAPWTLAVAAALALPALSWGAFPPAHADGVTRMATLVRTHRQHHEAIGTYGAFVRNLVFYTGVRQTDIVNDEQLVAFLASPQRVLVVLPAARLERVAGMLPQPVVRLAEVVYLDQAGLRLRSLLTPDPSRDIARVVLVANR